MIRLRAIVARAVVGVVTPLLASTLAISSLKAQPSVSAPVNAAIGRARSLMDAGDGEASRALLDSLVTQTPSGSDDRAESLYWRGVLSEKVSDAERDWKLLVIDAPLAARVPDALIRLSELDILRGKPAAARPQLERLLRDFYDAPQRPKALVLMARSYFEERDDARACEVITTLRAGDVPEGEIRLQAEELGRRCKTAAPSTAVEATAPAGGATATTGGATATTGGATATAVEETATAVSTSAFSVQLAAYDTKAQATALVNRLAKRGIKARIDGTRKPYRVRVGRYDTRAEATAALARLKKQGQSGFVAEIPR